MKLTFSILTAASAIAFTSCNQNKSQETEYEIPDDIEKPMLVTTDGQDASSQSTTVNPDSPPSTGNPDNSAVKALPPVPRPELDELKGKHTDGKLFLRYSISSGEIKKWNILAPYEIKVTDAYIEVLFAGNYYIDGEATGDGKKRLFIKKDSIHSIFVAE